MMFKRVNYKWYIQAAVHILSPENGCLNAFQEKPKNNGTPV